MNMSIIKKIQSALSVRLSRLWEMTLYIPEIISPKGYLFVQYAIPYRVKDNYNWGDDVNKYLVERLSGKKVIPYQCAQRKHTHYVCIGSVLQWHSDEEAIVWGAGLREPHSVRSCKKILAVRGPLTRTELITQGFECPEVYGDPVLLMPLFYKPVIKKKYVIGVIPHFSELDTFFVQKLLNRNDVHFIDIKHYGTYEHFVDEILSCEYILSSSLHGCIVSDAYEVPNLWCQFTDYKAESDGFKFKDYYQSVHKSIESPYDMRKINDLSGIINVVNNHWTKNEIDLDLLLSCCPFKKGKR